MFTINDITSSKDVLLYLQGLESALSGVVVPTPKNEQSKVEWVGITFKVENVMCIISMVEIESIIKIPDIAPLPGAQKWVYGLANIRGHLMPIISLKGYLNDSNVEVIQQQHRVLTVKSESFITGVVVQGVYGKKRVDGHTITDGVQNCPCMLEEHVIGMCEINTEPFYIVSFSQLIKSGKFTDVSGSR